jgi:hypothetical protein
MVVDLIAAFLIFVVIGGSIMWAWGDRAADAENRLFEGERYAMAEKTLDTIVRGRGLPENWDEGEPEGIIVLGIAKRELVVDDGKADKLAEWSDSDDDYAVLRTKLLIGGNDYYFRIIDPKSALEIPLLKAGKEPGSDGESTKVDSITVKRPVIFNYHREGEDEEGEKSQHEAIAELTLYTKWQWRQ